MCAQYEMIMSKVLILILVFFSHLTIAQPFFKVYESNLGRAPLSVSASNSNIFLTLIQNTTNDPFDQGALIQLQKLDATGTKLDSVFLTNVGFVFDSELINNNLYLAALLNDSVGHVAVLKYNQQLNLIHTDTIARRDTISSFGTIVFDHQKLQSTFVRNGIQTEAYTITYNPISAQKSTSVLILPATNVSNIYATVTTPLANSVYVYQTSNPLEVYLGNNSLSNPFSRTLRYNNRPFFALGKPPLISFDNNYLFTGYTSEFLGSNQGLYIEKGITNNLIRTDSIYFDGDGASLGPAFFKGGIRVDTSLYILSNHSTINGIVSVYPAQDYETSYHLTRLNNQLQPIWEHVEPTVGNNISPFYLTVQPNGDALIAGVIIKPSPAQANYRIFLSRISANGVASSMSDPEQLANRSLHLYPNPGNETLQWNLPHMNDGLWELRIYNMQGQLLLHADGSPEKTSTEFIPAGMYCVILKHPVHGSYNSKWVRM